MLFDFRGFFRFTYLWLFRSRWTARRALIAVAFLLVVPLFELATWLCLLLDELLFRRYRRRRVDSPVFIIGNPRSGTTFLHRLLAEDSERFSTMRMWEILFAPSITQRRFARALAAIDRRTGLPLRRRWHGVERTWSEQNVMHRVSLFAPEEDDYLLLHAWSALTLGLSAGLLQEALPYTYFDTALPAKRRARIMTFYRRCIQRHLHDRAARRDRNARPTRYLAKNPALCPKLDSLFAEFPDVKIVYLVRNPLEVLPSYLSMMRFSWRAVGVPVEGEALANYLLEMAGHWYRYPLERLAEAAEESYMIVRYDDLIRHPQRTVAEIYGRFGFDIAPDFARVLEAEAARAQHFRSRHEYDLEALGLSRERIVTNFRDVFERFRFPT